MKTDFTKTILIIEDDNAMRDNITEILQLAGYRALAAGNGSEGVALAREHHPDLVLCDIMMPGLDGFGVFHELNNDATTAGIPFVFLTAKTQLLDKLKGMNLGADDYLTKPFHNDILIAVVDSRIRKNADAKKSIENEQLKYISLLEEMLRTTSHRIRKPMASCLGLMQLLNREDPQEIKPEELKKILDTIKSNILDLDSFTKELTCFMHETTIDYRKKIGRK